MPSKDSLKKYLTPTEAAELLMVSPVTLRQWAQKGLIDARTTAGGHRRFSRQVLVDFAAQRGITLEFATNESADSENRLLVVDDNQQFNGYLVALFNVHQPQLEVRSAFDGFEAGRLVHMFQPNIVLLDIMMPGIDGLQVCERLKSDTDTSHIKVVAMTGHYSESLESRLLNAGAETLLRKPFSDVEVFTACGFEATPETEAS